MSLEPFHFKLGAIFTLAILFSLLFNIMKFKVITNPGGWVHDQLDLLESAPKFKTKLMVISKMLGVLSAEVALVAVVVDALLTTLTQ